MEANGDLLKAEIYIQRLLVVLLKLFDLWSFTRIWLWLPFLTFLSITQSFVKSNGTAMPSFLLSSYPHWARSKADAKCHSTFQQEGWARILLPHTSGVCLWCRASDDCVPPCLKINFWCFLFLFIIIKPVELYKRGRFCSDVCIISALLENYFWYHNQVGRIFSNHFRDVMMGKILPVRPAVHTRSHV